MIYGFLSIGRYRKCLRCVSHIWYGNKFEFVFRKESLCRSLAGFLLGSYICSFSLSVSSSDSESVLVMSIVSLLVFLCFFVVAVESVFSH
jgi:hypothetical protein